MKTKKIEMRFIPSVIHHIQIPLLLMLKSCFVAHILGVIRPALMRCGPSYSFSSPISEIRHIERKPASSSSSSLFLFFFISSATMK